MKVSFIGWLVSWCRSIVIDDLDINNGILLVAAILGGGGGRRCGTGCCIGNIQWIIIIFVVTGRTAGKHSGQFFHNSGEHVPIHGQQIIHVVGGVNVLILTGQMDLSLLGLYNRTTVVTNGRYFILQDGNGGLTVGTGTR